MLDVIMVSVVAPNLVTQNVIMLNVTLPTFAAPFFTKRFILIFSPKKSKSGDEGDADDDEVIEVDPSNNDNKVSKL
jgi:hypothetical protein